MILLKLTIQRDGEPEHRYGTYNMSMDRVLANLKLEIDRLEKEYNVDATGAA